MKASFVSNMSLQNAMRLTVSKAQKEMVQLQEETVTGRHADVGATLGAKTARTLNLHRDLQRMESLKSTNALTTQRLAASQEALGKMSEAANGAMEVLIALSMSAVTNPTAELAMEALAGLRGSEVHSSVILSPVDENVFKKLGANVTFEPVYQTHSLYHK